MRRGDRGASSRLTSGVLLRCPKWRNQLRSAIARLKVNDGSGQLLFHWSKPILRGICTVLNAEEVKAESPEQVDCLPESWARAWSLNQMREYR